MAYMRIVVASLLVWSLGWLYIVIKFRYDPMYHIANKDPRHGNIDFRHGAFYLPNYEYDWIKTVGIDPPFYVTKTFNVDTQQTKIISYSLYGNDLKYFKHAVERVAEAKRHYSEWAVRVYVHKTSKSSLIKRLVDAGAQVFVVHDDAMRPGNAAGMFWRFLPLANGSLSVMVKDIDDEIDKFDWLVQDLLQEQSRHKCFTGVWASPFPQSFVRGSSIIKLKSCRVAFTERDVRTCAVRMPFGADEVFMAKYAQVDTAEVHYAFFDVFSRIGWYFARSL